MAPRKPATKILNRKNMKPNIIKLAVSANPIPLKNHGPKGCPITKPRLLPRTTLPPLRVHGPRPLADLNPAAPLPELRNLLLISEDPNFYQTLRCVANRQNQIIVRLTGATGVDQVLQLLRPAAILLDLDLPRDVSWRLADKLLLDRNCPPVFLLTARTERFDVRTAIRSGSVIHKACDPLRLLQLVGQASGLTGVALYQRNASQRALLRWLLPCNWASAIAPTHPFRGVIE